jgi:hypothetical protein
MRWIGVLMNTTAVTIDALDCQYDALATPIPRHLALVKQLETQERG